MDSSFEKNYARELEIRRKYKEAEAQGSKEGMADAAGAYQVFRNSIMAEGDVYAGIYRLYSQAQDRGNECIDIDNDIPESKAGELADAFRSYGIKRFTYSSVWSGAARAAWQFIQHGWVLEGMAEVSSGDIKLFSDVYEKTYAYVFSIQ